MFKSLFSTLYMNSGLEIVAPASALCTTARDMYRWFVFLSSDGQATDRNLQLIKKETLEMIFQGILVSWFSYIERHSR